jgi:hypothetical protein
MTPALMLGALLVRLRRLASFFCDRGQYEEFSPQTAPAMIDDGVVIGAGSVVTAGVPAHSLAAGNPARVIRSFTGLNPPPSEAAPATPPASGPR